MIGKLIYAAAEQAEKSGNDLNDRGFTSTVEKRIRKKRDGEKYFFAERYSYFTKFLWIVPFLAFVFVVNYAPDTELGKFTYNYLLNNDIIRGGVFGAMVKLVFTGIAISVVAHFFAGIRHAFKYKDFRLFFDFIGVSFAQGGRIGGLWASFFFLGSFV